MGLGRFEVLTYDGDDLKTTTIHGRYRWRWLAEWMSRGVMRHRPFGAYVSVREVLSRDAAGAVTGAVYHDYRAGQDHD